MTVENELEKACALETDCDVDPFDFESEYVARNQIADRERNRNKMNSAIPDTPCPWNSTDPWSIDYLNPQFVSTANDEE